jgi:hypothetical protein
VPERPRSAPVDSPCTTRRHSRPSLQLERAWPRRLAPASRGMAKAIETELRRLVEQLGRWPTVRELRGEGLYGLCARSARRSAGARAGRAASESSPRAPAGPTTVWRRPYAPCSDATRHGRNGQGLRRCRRQGAVPAPPEKRKPGRLGGAPQSPPLARRFRPLLLAAQAPEPWRLSYGRACDDRSRR